MNRRDFMRSTSLLASATLLSNISSAAGMSFPLVRTPKAKRKFQSAAVERAIEEVKSSIGNKELAWLFENCFPNTLDTTVDYSSSEGKPDTTSSPATSTRCGSATARPRSGRTSPWPRTTNRCGC